MNERQQKILETLFALQSASVAELSRIFEVSPVTIRSDLNQLAEQGRVVRTHGGARIADGRTRQELTFATRQRINADQKQRIGELAATLVAPHDSILLDASTTAVALAQALKRSPQVHDITAVTTGVWTALELMDQPQINLVLAGGYIRSTTGSLAGSVTQNILASFNFTKAFLGAWGLTLEEGLTDTHLMEVELKRTIIERTRELVAIIDGSKFGRLGLASFADVERITCVVTDQTAPPDMVKAMRRRGVTVLIAPPSPQPGNGAG